MANYVVNRDVPSMGLHEVHVDTCTNLPKSWNQRNLGWHDDSGSAVEAASLFYSGISVCSCCGK